MTTVWTKINKASGTGWSKISSGVILYDDAVTTYDDPTVSYDGTLNDWTKISKPTIPLWSSASLPWQLASPWTVIGTAWTNIPKAT